MTRLYITPLPLNNMHTKRDPTAKTLTKPQNPEYTNIMPK